VTPTARALFAHPSEAHVRRHGPRGYEDYGNYKPWLRDDFAFRCVYCLFRESWSLIGGSAEFSVDHLEPQALAPHRRCDYTNLIYACLPCNSSRQDEAVPDPCAIGFGAVLRIADNCAFEGLTPDGNRMIELLRLNRPDALRARQRVLDLLARLQRARKDRAIDLARWFGYPPDLPDLSLLRPPGGNSLPDGVHQSHFARRARGELPATY
jgi:hypothetical protein